MTQYPKTILEDELDNRLQELDEECLRYLELRSRLRTLPEGEERDTTRGDLYALLTQLESSAEQTQEAWDAYTDALPDD